MNGFNHPACFVLRWLFVGLFMVAITHSFTAGHRMGFDPCRELLELTVIAAAAVWVQDRHSSRWTLVAVLILSAGMLRLVIASSTFSRYGVAIWTMAAVAMMMRRNWRNGRPGLDQTAANTGAAAQALRDPVQVPQPAYSFDDNVRQPRYRFADLIGMAETKRRLLAAGESIIHGARDKRNGVLLFGEPGNGKTFSRKPSLVN